MLVPAIMIVTCMMISGEIEGCVENVKPDGTYQVGPDGCIDVRYRIGSATKLVHFSI